MQQLWDYQQQLPYRCLHESQRTAMTHLRGPSVSLAERSQIQIQGLKHPQMPPSLDVTEMPMEMPMEMHSSHPLIWFAVGDMQPYS